MIMTCMGFRSKTKNPRLNQGFFEWLMPVAAAAPTAPTFAGAFTIVFCCWLFGIIAHDGLPF